MEATTTAPGAAQPAAPSGLPERQPPQLIEGVELIGEYQGSGYREPPYLARRHDGQVIQLTRLLYLVASHCDGTNDEADIAAAAGAAYGRELGDGDVAYLIEETLLPLGLVTGPNGERPTVEKSDPLLALTWRAGVVSEGVVDVLARAFQWLYHPAMLVLVLGALAVADIWLFAVHGITDPIRDAVSTPARVLGSLALVVLSAGFHEIGHAAAARYGGARPGRMGVGLYIAWPVFYTDVTDAYRLDRRGRLRTDLGGIYFNAIFIVALTTAAVLLGETWLLAVVLAAHLEVAHQLLPLLRLDGYYIVADATGVPDLFARIGAVLRSAIPGNETPDEVRVLKPWVRVAVTGWVLVVVPFLLFNLGVIVLNLPAMLGATVDAVAEQWATLRSATSVVDGAASLVGLVALSLPMLGVLGMLVRIGRRVTRWVAERLPQRAPAAVAGTARGWSATAGEVPTRSTTGAPHRPVPTIVDVGDLGDVRIVTRRDGTYIATVATPGGRIEHIEARDRASLGGRLSDALMGSGTPA